MSDDLPVLEAGNELGSDERPAAPNLPESAIDQALEALHLRGSTPIAESASDQHDSLPVITPEPTAGESSQPRSPSPTRRRVKRLPTKNVSRWYETLRSRRLRILATAVAGLLLAGLIAGNWRSSDVPMSGDELVEMDLSDFEDDLHFGAAGTVQSAEPKALEEFTEAEPASYQSQVSRPDSGERLQPVNFVTPSEQPWPSSGLQTAGGFAPSAKRGSQGAWLTGQIETDSLDSSKDDSPARRSGFGDSR